MAEEGRLVGFIVESDDHSAAVSGSVALQKSAEFCEAKLCLFWRMDGGDGKLKVLNVYDFSSAEGEIFKNNARALESSRRDGIKYKFFDVTRGMLADAAENVLGSWRFVLGSG